MPLFMESPNFSQLCIHKATNFCLYLLSFTISILLLKIPINILPYTDTDGCI